MTRLNDPTAHAEMIAIREAAQNSNDFQLTHCTLYTSCEPCPMCLGAVYWARFEKIVYAYSREDAANIGFDDNFIYEEISKMREERKIPIKQLNAQILEIPMDAWTDSENKTLY